MLTKMMKHLHVSLSVHRALMYCVNNHLTGYIGYFQSVAKKMKVIALEKILGSSIVSQINSFVFTTRVGELYNQCVLNMSQLITWETIDTFERQVRSNPEYFAFLWRLNLFVNGQVLIFRRRLYLQRKKHMTSYKYHFVGALNVTNI
jgi:hypothetical protein